MNTAFQILAIGVIATAFLDIWIIFLQPRLMNAPFKGFDLVGRWAAYFPQGKFTHDDVAKAAPMPNEVMLGWLIHYMVGILFAAVLIAAAGIEWLTYPTAIPALLVGLFSVAAPFLIMHPAFGMGIAASKTPDPKTARFRSVLTHTIFGLCLYAAGLAVKAVLT